MSMIIDGIDFQRKYGLLTPIGIPTEEQIEEQKKKNKRFKGKADRNKYIYCNCDCGNTTIVWKRDLLRTDGRQTLSCGCLQKKRVSETSLKNLKGMRFGKLTALYPTGENYSDGSAIWRCQCECGNYKDVSSNCLLFNRVGSCGCLKSRKEYEISQLLISKNISFTQQYSFEDLIDKSKLLFDFAIFSKDNLLGLIEYNGKQHYDIESRFGSIEQFYRMQEHDRMKMQYCKDHNIPLLIVNTSNYTEDYILQWIGELQNNEHDN